MKKILFTCLLLFCLTISCAFAATTVEFTIDSADYYVQTNEIAKSTTLAAPFIKNSRTMVPVRALCEAFGSEVAWDDATRTVTVTKGDTNVSLVIGSDKIAVNGEEKAIDCPAEIVNDITFIPLRAVSENMGYYVYYVDSTRQILIDDVAPVMSINGTDIPYNVFSNIYALNSQSIDETSENAAAMKSYLINEVYSLVADVYTMGSEAAKNNVVLTEEEKAQIASEADKIRSDETINKSVLSGSVIKYLQDYQAAEKNANNIYNSVQPDRNEISEYYKENYVCAKHVLIEINDSRTEEEALKIANEVYSRAKAGEDFDLLVDEYGEDPGMENNAQGYIFTKGEMVAEFEETTYALQDGEISEPVKTSYGYHVIAKLPLPNDANILNSLTQAYIESEYQAQLNSIYSNAGTTVNIAPEELISIMGI